MPKDIELSSYVGPDLASPRASEDAPNVPISDAPLLNRPKKAPAWKRYLFQLHALNIKNALLFRRGWKSTIAYLVAPLFFVTLFGLIQYMMENSDKGRYPVPFLQMGGKSDELPNMPPCIVFDSEGGKYGKGQRIPGATCITLVYAPNNDSTVNAIMGMVGKLNSLSIAGTEAIPPKLDSTTNAPGIFGFRTQDEMSAYLQDPSSEGRVAGGLLFTETGSVEGKLAFEIWYNHTRVGKYLSGAGQDPMYRATNGLSSYVLQLQRAVSEALLALNRGAESATLRVQLRRYPELKSEGQKVAGLDVAAMGGVFYFCAVMFIFILALRQMVAEKENHLLAAMRTEGLFESAYWISWLLYFMFITVLSSLLIVLGGKASGIDVFIYTDFSVMYALFLTYSIAMVTLAMCLAAVLPSTRVANIIGFLLFAFGLILEVMLSTTGGLLTYTLYDPFLVPSAVATILNLYPPMLFSKVSADIYQMTKPFFEKDEVSGVLVKKSDGYSTANLADGPYVYGFAGGILGNAADKATLTYNDCYSGSPQTACFVSLSCPPWVGLMGTKYIESRNDCWFNHGNWVKNLNNRWATGICLDMGPVCKYYEPRATFTEPDSWDVNGRTVSLDDPLVNLTYGIPTLKGRVGSCECRFHVPSDADALTSMVLASLMFVALTWYFAQAFPGEHGRPQPLYFVLLLSYWFPDYFCKTPHGGGADDFSAFDVCLQRVHHVFTACLHRVYCCRRNLNLDAGENTPRERPCRKDSDVSALEARIAAGECDDCPVRVVNLVKMYNPGWMICRLICLCCKRKRPFRAVNGLTISMERGQVFALLGHNGAGKSTTIKCMIGMVKASFGDVFINGFSVSRQTAQVKQQLGCCPQHDILWNELTAWEHMSFFGRFHGISGDDLAQRASQLLEDVKLGEVMHLQSGTYSGGMKRRLSVAIAALGEKHVIFLDEPTTGMDPMNRQHVWSMIEKLKHDKSIVLTTHAMEEADALADTIGIMSHGKLICVGNSLHLKSKFGGGYELKLVIPPGGQARKRAMDKVKQLAPSAMLTDDAAGALTYAIDRQSTSQIPKLFKWIEANNSKNKKRGDISASAKGAASSGVLLTDWAISHTTLEDVFIRLTRENEDKVPTARNKKESKSATNESKLQKETVNLQKDDFLVHNPMHQHTKKMDTPEHDINTRKGIEDPSVPSMAFPSANEQPHNGASAAKIQHRRHTKIRLKATNYRQFKALMMKTITLQIRQRKTMIAQIMLPIWLILGIWAMQYFLIDTIADTENTELVYIKNKCNDCESKHRNSDMGARACCLDPFCYCGPDHGSCNKCIQDFMWAKNMSQFEAKECCSTRSCVCSETNPFFHSRNWDDLPGGIFKAFLTCQTNTFPFEAMTLIDERNPLYPHVIDSCYPSASCLTDAESMKFNYLWRDENCIPYFYVNEGKYTLDDAQWFDGTTMQSLMDLHSSNPWFSGMYLDYAYDVRYVPGPTRIWVTIPEDSSDPEGLAAFVGDFCYIGGTDDGIPLGVFTSPRQEIQFVETANSECNNWDGTIFPKPHSAIGGKGTPCANCATCEYTDNIEGESIPAESLRSRESLLSYYPTSIALQRRVVDTPWNASAGDNGQRMNCTSQDYSNLRNKTWQQQCFGYTYASSIAFCPPFFGGKKSSIINPGAIDDNAYELQVKFQQGQLKAKTFDEAKEFLDDNFPGAVLTFNQADILVAEPYVDLSIQSIFATRFGENVCNGECEAFCNLGMPVSGKGGKYEYFCAPSSSVDPDSYVVPNYYYARYRAKADDAWFDAPEVRGESFLLAGLTTAMLRMQIAKGGAAGSSLDLPANITIAIGVRPFPYRTTMETEFDLGLDTILTGVINMLFPLATSFMLPVFVFLVVHEKELRLKAMMTMMGLRLRIYWLVQYLFDLVMVLSMTLVVFGLSTACGIRVVTRSEGSLVFSLLFLWGNVLIGLAFFISALFNRTRVANLTCYLSIIFSVTVSLVLSLTVLNDVNTPAPVALYIWPPFAYYRGIFLLSQKAFFWFDVSETEMGTIMTWLACQFVLLIIAAAYLDAVLPREFGVPLHPLFPLHGFFRLWKNCLRRLNLFPNKRFDSTSSNNMGTPTADTHTIGRAWNASTVAEAKAHARRHSVVAQNILCPKSNEYVDPINEDPDVTAERSLLMNGGVPDNVPIKILALRKVYPGGKVAVDSVSLHTENNECFGFLGPNGAGKTTTISMLTGLFHKTAGDAYINGHDISTEMPKIYERMGICPQFDVVWPSLTILEHLLFYARLKGVTGDNNAVTAVVVDAARRVKLGKFLTRRSSELSGGMRRRLSLAISFLGNPAVVFLDEPTTGLDPETRRDVWAFVERQKVNGRCIVLTTHAMDEADALCSRIGIMAHGRLRCLGSNLHLKNKFGSGYKIDVVLSKGPGTESEVQARADVFLQRVLPKATLISSFGVVRVYQVRREDIHVSSLFEKMAIRDKNISGVEDWGLRQTSLEEVFLRIAKESEQEWLNELARKNIKRGKGNI